MLRFVLWRLAAAVPTLLGVIVVAFAVLYLMPGDPVAVLVGNMQGEVSAEQVQQIRDRFGLNDPILVQFGNYLADISHGDFGTSVLKGRPVSDLILEALPHTLQLAGLALLFSVIIGVTLGVISAARRGTWTDRGTIFVSLLGVSMPDFWMAIMAVLIFAVSLQWFPAFGVGDITFLILPALVLGIRASAAIARLTRSSMLEVLTKQYVTTARAKGIGELTIVNVHALRNALIPVVTLLGLEFGRLIGGAVIVETVFARQGLGSLLIQSILDKDVPVLRGTVLVVAGGYLIINLVVDLTYGWLDPRIRLATSRPGRGKRQTRDTTDGHQARGRTAEASTGGDGR
jgi:peptide/nickel transport system permease protein